MGAQYSDVVLHENLINDKIDLGRVFKQGGDANDHHKSTKSQR